ncbi:GntR family transcriptional regulator [Streptomyces sp. NBC_00582]|uniref:GntR family transcriptional regulator n=1 Tax=Streptomyces sp. NBC_00582 TaxID=2975783 RepID=UPI002E812C88|nr:GntR family transcriptional regulator [Streptomyces sp. NBC_00582]WUB61553.1 GntR family transcriptional regulator [Streptomyces sp. NBC_00582]
MTDPAQPTYMRVAERIRRRILDGDLAEGAKLPPVRELAKAEGVAVATLGRSLDQLQVEGYITTSRRGTFVSNAPAVTASGHDRVVRVQRTGSVLSEGETMIVTSAELIVPPLYVAEIFGLDEGDQVVRRQWHTGRGSQRLMLAVTWYPAQFAAVVPELLSTSRTSSPGLLAKVQEETGRKVVAGRDDMHARDADSREAGFLGLRVGSPILAGAHRLWDDQGVIEYGEWCLPYRLVIGYEYSIG